MNILSIERPFGIANATVEITVGTDRLLDADEVLKVTRIAAQIADCEDGWDGNSGNWYGLEKEAVELEGESDDFNAVMVTVSLNLRSKICIKYFMETEE
ncbi:hypothetical protein [Enterovibrio calviensis]|uniref:hypothetical protein n=1 Tax=Enterovibrio calviensis TaxID=91359 RepID=UPI0004877E37|nr:hypothetical protein [Enterovibrio calviensis]